MTFGLRDYHPHQMAFCGYSGSGKTTLIEKLIAHFSPEKKMGYVKHDAHKFEVDRSGKDTWRMGQAGAQAVFISNESHSARMAQNSDAMLKPHLFLDCDAVLVEGHKRAPFSKVLLLQGDPERDLSLCQEVDMDTVVAFVGMSLERPSSLQNQDQPYFHRDDLSSISSWLLEQWMPQAPECSGLVLAGGRSQRMKRDKAQLIYDAVPQVQRAYELLKAQLGEVWVSGRPDQGIDLPFIGDRFLDMGPMGGILSAMSEHPHRAWLVVAVDMPYLDDLAISELQKQRDPFKVATTYLNPENHLPEPLCSIYEPKAKASLHQFLAYDIRCPRKVLLNTNTKGIPCPSPRALDNANTPEDYQKIVQDMKVGK